MNDPPHPRFVVPPANPLPVQDSPEKGQETAVRQFVASVGGLVNARAALELLALLQGSPGEPSRKAA